MEVVGCLGVCTASHPLDARLRGQDGSCVKAYRVGGGTPHLFGSLEFVAFGEVAVGFVEEVLGGLDVFGGDRSMLQSSLRARF